MKVTHFKFLSLTLVISMLLSGCSYKDFDDNLQTELNKITEDKVVSLPDGGLQSVDGNGDTIIIQEPNSGDRVIFKEAGETFSSFVQFKMSDGEVVDWGLEGLDYTFNSITVYDSIYDSPIEVAECAISENRELDLKMSHFAVVDMTASYHSEKELDPNINKFSLGMELYFEYENNSGNYIVYPELIYFSEHPKEKTKTFNPVDDYMAYPILENNDSMHFQVGIIVSAEILETETLCLSIGPKSPLGVEGNCQYFCLLSKADNTE